MTIILHLRARRFHSLYALLTGEVGLGQRETARQSMHEANGAVKRSDARNARLFSLVFQPSPRLAKGRPTP